MKKIFSVVAVLLAITLVYNLIKGDDSSDSSGLESKAANSQTASVAEGNDSSVTAPQQSNSSRGKFQVTESVESNTHPIYDEIMSIFANTFYGECESFDSSSLSDINTATLALSADGKFRYEMKKGDYTESVIVFHDGTMNEIYPHSEIYTASYLGDVSFDAAVESYIEKYIGDLTITSDRVTVGKAALNGITYEFETIQTADKSQTIYVDEKRENIYISDGTSTEHLTLYKEIPENMFSVPENCKEISNDDFMFSQAFFDEYGKWAEAYGKRADATIAVTNNDFALLIKEIITVSIDGIIAGSLVQGDYVEINRTLTPATIP